MSQNQASSAKDTQKKLTSSSATPSASNSEKTSKPSSSSTPAEKVTSSANSTAANPPSSEKIEKTASSKDGSEKSSTGVQPQQKQKEKSSGTSSNKGHGSSSSNNASGGSGSEQEKLLNPPSKEFVLKNQMGYLEAGKFFINKNQFDNALKIYELLNDVNPNKGIAQILAGHCAFRLKKHDKVISCYQKAMELSAKANKDSNIHFELGIANYKQGRFNESEQFFNKVNVYQPKYIYQPIVDLHKGILKRQNGYYQEAAQLFLQSLIQNDKNIFNQQKTVEILCNAGLQFEHMKELEDAQLCYLKAKQVESTNSNALKCLSWVLFQKKSYRESADLIQKAYQQNSKDFEILLILAKNYDQSGQVKQALEFFNKAIQLNNQNAICWCYLGITFFKLNMMKDAFSCFNKSFELENNIETLFNIALLYEIGKHFIEAINLYKQILLVCPDDHMVVRRKITIERNASSQTHDPFNKKQLNKLRTMLREPPFKPNVPLWLEELDPNVRQRLIEHEKQELLNSLASNQIHLSQLHKSPIFPVSNKVRSNSIYNLHTPNIGYPKEPFDSLLNTPNLFFQTPKPHYDQQFSLTPVSYPLNNNFDKAKAGSNRSIDYLQANNVANQLAANQLNGQKRKIDTPGNIGGMPLYADQFNSEQNTPGYKISPYESAAGAFGGVYKNSFDASEFYRNRTNSISPLIPQNMLKIEDTSFTPGSKMVTEEDDPHNINKGFKLRKNSEYDRQLKASITSNISPIQRPVKKHSENHSDSDSNHEKPLKKQVKIVSLSNPLLTNVPAQHNTTQQQQQQQNNTQAPAQSGNSPQKEKEIYYGSLMGSEDQQQNAIIAQQKKDEETASAQNQRFNIFSNLGKNKK